MLRNLSIAVWFCVGLSFAVPSFGQHRSLLDSSVKLELDRIPVSHLGDEVVDWNSMIDPLYNGWLVTAFDVRHGPLTFSEVRERRTSEYEETKDSSRFGHETESGKRTSKDDVDRASARVKVAPKRGMDGLRYWYDFGARNVVQVNGLVYESYGPNLKSLSTWNLHRPDGPAASFDEHLVPKVIVNYERKKLHGPCCLIKDGLPYFVISYRSGRPHKEFAFNAVLNKWVECTGNDSAPVKLARTTLANTIKRDLDSAFERAYAETSRLTSQARNWNSKQRQAELDRINAKGRASMQQIQEWHRRGGNAYQ